MRLLLMALIAVVSCTHQTQKKIDESQISDSSRKILDDSRDLIRENKLKQALVKLVDLNDNNIGPIEKSLKYNLKGVILFNMSEVDKAILNFIVAEKYAPQDTQLYSQVQLNMASGYFKEGKFSELKDHLYKVDKKQLSDVEKKKYGQLLLAYGNKHQNPQMIVSAMLMLMSDLKSFDEVKKSNLYDGLKTNFSTLAQNQKIEVLEDFDGSKNMAVAQLAQVEAEQRFVSGDKSGAKDVAAWLRSEYEGNAEVDKFIKDFELRMDNSTQISLGDIGLVLPLSGDKASFGQKALSGVDTGLKVLGLGENTKIHTKDSVDNPAQGAQAVLELIREKKVAFIIGGLFPDSAKAEYLEAKKYGVLYISLSQINLPKEEKNNHLIEVQGSIESQVETLLSDEMIKKFGGRIGVIFPDNEGGKAYADEVWRKSQTKNVQITSLAGFPKNTHDYRDTAQLFLGLMYPRERSEELNILDDVYGMEKTTIRRVQTLPPVIDFDWVFMATYPHEAAQLIPTLGYYDANRIKVIGGPSWVSKSMVKEQKNLGTLYFVGDDPKDINQDLLNQFNKIYGKQASLIEVIALDAMKIGAEALREAGAVAGREEFDTKLKTVAHLTGLTTGYDLKDGVWLKRMNAMTITRGETVKLFEAESLAH